MSSYSYGTNNFTMSDFRLDRLYSNYDGKRFSSYHNPADDEPIYNYEEWYEEDYEDWGDDDE